MLKEMQRPLREASAMKKVGLARTSTKAIRTRTMPQRFRVKDDHTTHGSGMACPSTA
jgi:hypothetical protein